MNRPILAVLAAFLLASPALAANENNHFDRFQVTADSIEMGNDNVMHARGNVVVADDNTEIHMDEAKISTKDGKTFIEAAVITTTQ